MITKSDAKQLQRRNPAGLVRLVEVQEQQIAAQRQQITALEAVLTALTRFRLVYDHVDPATGEVWEVWA